MLVSPDAAGFRDSRLQALKQLSLAKNAEHVIFFRELVGNIYRKLLESPVNRGLKLMVVLYPIGPRAFTRRSVAILPCVASNDFG